MNKKMILLIQDYLLQITGLNLEIISQIEVSEIKKILKAIRQYEQIKGTCSPENVENLFAKLLNKFNITKNKAAFISLVLIYFSQIENQHNKSSENIMFFKFYENYPRKCYGYNLAKAMALFKKIIKTQDEFDRLCYSLENYKKTSEYANGFIYNLQSFLLNYARYVILPISGNLDVRLTKLIEAEEKLYERDIETGNYNVFASL